MLVRQHCEASQTRATSRNGPDKATLRNRVRQSNRSRQATLRSEADRVVATKASDLLRLQQTFFAHSRPCRTVSSRALNAYSKLSDKASFDFLCLQQPSKKASIIKTEVHWEPMNISAHLRRHSCPTLAADFLRSQQTLLSQMLIADIVKQLVLPHLCLEPWSSGSHGVICHRDTTQAQSRCYDMFKDPLLRLCFHKVKKKWKPPGFLRPRQTTRFPTPSANLIDLPTDRPLSSRLQPRRLSLQPLQSHLQKDPFDDLGRASSKGLIYNQTSFAPTGRARQTVT